jgi:hypothetical protein
MNQDTLSYSMEDLIPLLAGLFEGDGYVSKQLKIGLIDQDLISWIASILGTNVSCRTFSPELNRKPMYETSLARKDELYAWYKDFYPYFSERRQQRLQTEVFNTTNPLPKDRPNLFCLDNLPEAHEHIPEKDLTHQEFAYLAGYFMAEGSIGADSRSKSHGLTRPYVTFESVDHDVIAYVSTLLGQPYSCITRLTNRFKLVYRVCIQRAPRLKYIFEGLLPYVSMSSRHHAKIMQALNDLQTLEKWRSSHGRAQLNANMLSQLTHPNVKAFKDKRMQLLTFSDAEWKELATIFQNSTFLFFVTNRTDSSKKVPRLRIQSSDQGLVERAAYFFGTQVHRYKVSVRTHQPHFSTQLESKRRVSFLLKGTVCYLNGAAAAKSLEGLEWFATFGRD